MDSETGLVVNDLGGSLSAVVYEDSVTSGEKGVFKDSGELVRKIVQIHSEDLSASIGKFCRQITAIAEKIDLTGGFGLDSIDVLLEVTAKGEVRLIGSAAAEAKGGLKLTFKRRDFFEPNNASKP